MIHLSEPSADLPERTPPPLLLRINDAARTLAISPRSIWRLVGLGELTAVRCGRATRITVASIEAYIAKGGSE